MIAPDPASAGRPAAAAPRRRPLASRAGAGQADAAATTISASCGRDQAPHRPWPAPPRRGARPPKGCAAGRRIARRPPADPAPTQVRQSPAVGEPPPAPPSARPATPPVERRCGRRSRCRRPAGRGAGRRRGGRAAAGRRGGLRRRRRGAAVAPAAAGTADGPRRATEASVRPGDPRDRPRRLPCAEAGCDGARRGTAGRRGPRRRAAHATAETVEEPLAEPRLAPVGCRRAGPAAPDRWRPRRLRRPPAPARAAAEAGTGDGARRAWC